MLRRLLGTLVSGLGRTERRVVGAIVVTALIPLLVQLFVGRAIINQILATAFQPEFEAHLEQSLGVYADLAKSIKREFHAEGRSIALGLVPYVPAPKHAMIEARLEAILREHPSLVSLEVRREDDTPIARRMRAQPVDEKKERTLLVSETIDSDSGNEAIPPPLRLDATFATPRARFDEMDEAQAFAQGYRQLVEKHREEWQVQAYARLNAVVLACTILLAIVAGVLVVRPVTRRIRRLAEATIPVAEGDLSVRFADAGNDEVGDLGRSFNRMLEELARSRARIEFLRRMSEWQKVARRLAHEIKNPLTPIQLAVQECHSRYTGDDPAYKRIVQTTLEVVEEEVGTLRRLVGEFSSFARLPKAELHEGDLGDFLREQRAHLVPEGDANGEGSDASEAALLRRVDLVFSVPDAPMPALMDREMLHRVLGNLVVNAAQALRDARGQRSAPIGRVSVSSSIEGDEYLVDVDDDGPGIDASLGDQIFDPYVTTKRDGTGLGLSIVKKIIVDHGGAIDVARSPLGGARFRIRLPRAGSPAALAAAQRVEAKEEGEDAPPPSAKPGATRG